MCYTHTFKLSNDILFAYENNILSGELSYEINNNELKICNFYSGCVDPEYKQGIEMILFLLRRFKNNVYRIYGVLSTEDAKSEYIEIGTNKHKLVGWQVSIPFYAGLTRYIPNSQFVLYDGIGYRKNNITKRYEINSIETIDYLINQNQNCSFSIEIDNICLTSS